MELQVLINTNGTIISLDYNGITVLKYCGNLSTLYDIIWTIEARKELPNEDKINKVSFHICNIANTGVNIEVTMREVKELLKCVIKPSINESKLKELIK